MNKIIDAISNAFSYFGLAQVMIIIMSAVVIYYALTFLKRNNGLRLAISSLLLIFFGGLYFLMTDLSGDIFLLLVSMLCLLIFSVFSFELKRDLWNKKGRSFDLSVSGGNESETVDRCTSEIIKALQNMSKNDIGSILILSNSNLPSQILESGVMLDSDISSQIIESVFFPKSPLHDGAMIINGQKIQAAGCFLPLSQEVNLPKELGTRHRAGIGITEALNVTALIVSEETGIISIAKSGKIKRYADADMLKNTLKEFYWQAYLVSDKKRRD